MPTALADLAAAGFPADATGVLEGGAAARRFRDLGGDPGPWGLLQRLSLSMGADLDLARQAEQELLAGNALVEIAVEDAAAKQRAGDVLQRHGGHFIKYFDRWTIETLA